MQGRGFLAIWSDVQPHQETDYLHWLTREHTAERVGVQGFLSVRVFRALISDVSRFFILYDLKGPEVLAGPDYLARLNAPTPWSTRIMPILGNFVRGGGRCAASVGMGQGGIVTPLLLRDTARASSALNDIIAMDRIAAAHLLETDNSRTSIQTNEKKLRQNDSSFEGLLLIEALDQNALRSAVDRVLSENKDALQSTDIINYALFFALDRSHLTDAHG